MATPESPPYSKELPFEVVRPRDFRLGKDREGPWHVQEKLDGEYVAVAPGLVHGKRKSQRGVYENKWDMLPAELRAELRLALQELQADGVTWIEGELIVLGGTSTDVKHVLKNPDEGEVQFVAFRIPELHHRIKPFDQIYKLHMAGFHVPRCLDFAGVLVQDGGTRNYHVRSEHDVETLLATAEREDIEGFVLWEDACYPDCRRVKHTNTYDLVVTGVKIGNAGKFAGICGSLECAWWRSGKLIGAAAVSGMDDATRGAISGEDVGRVVEVKCNGIGSQGRLRHPRFVRWRDDKSPGECVAP